MTKTIGIVKDCDLLTSNDLSHDGIGLYSVSIKPIECDYKKSDYLDKINQKIDLVINEMVSKFLNEFVTENVYCYMHNCVEVAILSKTINDYGCSSADKKSKITTSCFKEKLYLLIKPVLLFVNNYMENNVPNDDGIKYSFAITLKCKLERIEYCKT